MVDGRSIERESYSQYRAEVESGHLVGSLRTGCAVVAVLSSAFIPLDYVVFRESFIPMLGFRIFCNAVMVAIIFWGAKSQSLNSAVVGCLTTGAMLLMVIAAAGGVTSDYTPGLMLLFLGMPVILPLTALQAGFIVSVLTIGLAILPLLSSAVVDLESYFLHMVFPIAAGVESVSASALLDRLRYGDYLRRREIEQARDELKELDREKSRFTANIHHELRTPLTLMLAPVDALLSGAFGPIENRQKSYLETIRSNGRRLLKLINDLLDLAKIEDGKLTITRERIDLAEMVEQYVANAQPLAQRKQIELMSNWDGGESVIWADPTAIDKVIGNLIGNALKFTETGGQVCITGHQSSDDNVEFSVCDTGIGMPREKLKSIFDRFAQVDSRDTRRFGGTGIGLSLVKDLVSLHGGHVWAESDGVGRGSKMVVSLPIGEGANKPSSPTRDRDSGNWSSSSEDSFVDCDPELQLIGAAAPVRQSSEIRRHSSILVRSCPAGAPRILIADDNSDMRRLLADLLSDEYEVATAKNGRDAFRQIRSCPPNLVLTDVMMPEMSGIDLCKAIKESESFSMIPVVLVTSRADQGMKVEGLEIGADDYITKPFHPAELLARVRSIIKMSLMQAEISEKNKTLISTNEKLSSAIKELKDTESALVLSERLAAVGELAAGVAHEVNNPVNFAMNSLRTLEEYVRDIKDVLKVLPDLDGMPDQEARVRLREFENARRALEFESLISSLDELVKIVMDGLVRTNRLVGDLKEFATAKPVASSPVDLARCVSSTVSFVKLSALSVGVEIAVESHSELAQPMGNPQAINQVILNLLKNAIESVGNGGGHIWVRMFSDEFTVGFEIEDDGPGVIAANRVKIFEPFFTSRPAGNGTGLGLAICRRVVTEHMGKIELCDGEFGGAKFRVTLPVERGEVERNYAAET